MDKVCRIIFRPNVQCYCLGTAARSSRWTGWLIRTYMYQLRTCRKKWCSKSNRRKRRSRVFTLGTVGLRVQPPDPTYQTVPEPLLCTCQPSTGAPMRLQLYAGCPSRDLEKEAFNIPEIYSTLWSVNRSSTATDHPHGKTILSRHVRVCHQAIVVLEAR